MSERLYYPAGGYRELKAYQVTEVVYDATVAFTRLYLQPRSRTVDQMVQAARSGKQNIAEGNMAAATSKKSEMKLINVARASLEELLLDYEDFLRQNRLTQWPKDHEKAIFIRKLRPRSPLPHGDATDATDATDRTTCAYDTYRQYVEDKGPENAANTVICLIKQASYLLDRYLKVLDDGFQEKGGFTEKLQKVRIAKRGTS